MIKGVQHQIIEIRQTDDPYFERALLFVRAELAEEDEAQLREEGTRFLDHTGSFTGLRHGRAMCWFKRTALLLSGGFLGTLLGAAIALAE